MRGRRPTGGKCYNTLSARSSQINSHSNTDSCSRQSSLRYLEAEMARLHDSRRPLVVSFRRKKTQVTKTPKQVTILDYELQNALNNLKQTEPLQTSIKCGYEDIQEYEIPVYNNRSTSSAGDCSFIELHSLQPRHICPVNGSKLPFLLPTYPKVDNIEMYKEQRFKINRMKRRRHKESKNNTKETFSLNVPDVDTFLTKSCTMPHMVSECETIQMYKCTGNSLSLTSSNWNISNEKKDDVVEINKISIIENDSSVNLIASDLKENCST